MSGQEKKQLQEDEQSTEKKPQQEVNKSTKKKGKGSWVIFILAFVVIVIAAGWISLNQVYQVHKRQQMASEEDQNAGVKNALEVSKNGIVDDGVAGGQQNIGEGRVGYEKEKVPAIPVSRTTQAGEKFADQSLDQPLFFEEDRQSRGGSGGGYTVATPSVKKGYEVDPTQMSSLQNLTGKLLPNSSVSANSGALNLDSMKTPGMRATRLGNRNFIVAKGEMIDCVLNTALQSTSPGMASCTVTKDIYSDNGKVVLIDQGTIATGEYKAEIKPGMSRISVLWNRLRTPQGVVIDLDSPGSDSLGRGGLDGSIDNHWGERLGAAFMLSFVQDAIGYAAAVNAPAGNATNYYQNTQNTGKQMADTVLQQTISIPPTLNREHGSRLSIFIARDLDFSDVYELKPLKSLKAMKDEGK